MTLLGVHRSRESVSQEQSHNDCVIHTITVLVKQPFHAQEALADMEL